MKKRKYEYNVPDPRKIEVDVEKAFVRGSHYSTAACSIAEKLLDATPDDELPLYVLIEAVYLYFKEKGVYTPSKRFITPIITEHFRRKGVVVSKNKVNYVIKKGGTHAD